MSIRKPLSVQKRMTGIIFLVSTFVLILTSLQFVYVELKRSQDVAYSDISLLSRLISTNVSFDMAIKDTARAENVLASLAARKDVVSSYLVLPDGKTIASYTRSRNSFSRRNFSNEIKFIELEARHIAEGLNSGAQRSWQEGGRLEFFMPVTYAGSLVGYNYLSMELTNLRKYQLYLALGWLLTLGPALLLTYFLSSRMQKYISGPIEQLAERMGQISREKRLVGFDPKDSEDEFSLLFNGFDEMMRALKERDQMLERHRKDLELEVQVRTRALEAEKEKAEQATLAKSRFLANMSHEIRTPMIGVLGMADVLRQKDFAEQDKQLVETIYRSGEALLTILNDILDFSKIEAGKLALDPEPVNLGVLLEDVTRVMEVNAHEKGIDMICNVPEEQPVVLGDSGRIRQVLLNLVGNAVKFTEQGSVTASLEMKTRANGALCECIFVVRDTGVGIPQAVQDRIFDSFDQGDSSSTRSHGGTGLGLAIVKELATLMDGEVAVESTPGEGSTFFVKLLLPLAGQSHASFVEATTPTPLPVIQTQTAAETTVATGARWRVLLAEDNPTTQNLISILLQQLGLSLAIVDNGLAALGFLEQETVDLILMDCQMPQMDGFEATKNLRSRGVSTPVIALTAYARAEDEQECLDAGMNDFLSKPFRQSELKDVLVRWLGTDVLDQEQRAGAAS